MKSFSLSILLCVLLIGCTELYDDSGLMFPSLIPRYIYITAEPTSMYLGSYAYTQPLNIKSNHTTWRLVNDVDWINLSQTSGDSDCEVNVGVAENRSLYVSRIGVFYLMANINSWKNELPITITQAGEQPYINVSKPEIIFSGAENTEEITVSANCTWKAYSGCEWLTFNKKDSILTISASRNTTGVYRNTKISIEHIGNIDCFATITVRQAPTAITASTKTLTFGNEAGSVDVAINADDAWIATSDDSWIDVSPQPGEAGNSTMRISVAPNTSTSQRTGFVTMYLSNREVLQIPVQQDGVYIDVDNTSMTFAASGSSNTLKISSNTSWTIVDCPSWISISQTNGKGNWNIVLTAAENPSTNERFAKIRLTQNGVTTGSVITLTQKAKNMQVTTQNIEFEDKSESKKFEIYADDVWSIQNDNPWISISPNSGRGNSLITLTASENESESSRLGNIYITMLDKTLSVRVRQNGKVFSAGLDNTSITFPAAGGNSLLNVMSNTYWTLSDYPSWITLSKQNGKGNATVTVTAADNPNTAERSSLMYLQIDGKNERIPIMLTQSGKSFTIQDTALTFSDLGGEQSVTIETDGKWSVTSDCSWILVTPSSAVGKGILKVFVSENTTDAQRSGGITVTMGDKSLTIMVIQKEKYLNIDNPLLSYPSKGGSIGITVTTNDSWGAYAEDNSSWLSVSPNSGSGTADIKVVASDNPSVNKRSGYVVVKPTNGQAIRIVVNQDARYLTLNHNSVLFYSKGGTSEAITVSTDGTYKVSTSDPWLTVNESHSAFTITASGNEAIDSRIGTITVSLSDLTEGEYIRELTVKQLGRGGSFITKDFGEDNNWDSTGSPVNLNIIPFGDEKNYDSNSASGIKLSVTGYRSDKNWN